MQSNLTPQRYVACPTPREGVDCKNASSGLVCHASINPTLFISVAVNAVIPASSWSLGLPSIQKLSLKTRKSVDLTPVRDLKPGDNSSD